tara:strand:+ start:156 stop:347 length:192 start_codon:yes stop_codon:yes gene_type:complete
LGNPVDVTKAFYGVSSLAVIAFRNHQITTAAFGGTKGGFRERPMYGTASLTFTLARWDGLNME